MAFSLDGCARLAAGFGDAARLPSAAMASTATRACRMSTITSCTGKSTRYPWHCPSSRSLPVRASCPR